MAERIVFESCAGNWELPESARRRLKVLRPAPKIFLVLQVNDAKATTSTNGETPNAANGLTDVTTAATRMCPTTISPMHSQ